MDEGLIQFKFSLFDSTTKTIYIQKSIRFNHNQMVYMGESSEKHIHITQGHIYNFFREGVNKRVFSGHFTKKK